MDFYDGSSEKKSVEGNGNISMQPEYRSQIRFRERVLFQNINEESELERFKIFLPTGWLPPFEFYRERRVGTSLMDARRR